MNIKKATFVASNISINKCPQDGYPEYALIGRSNVGKSSLINMLTRKKNLALTSSMPGKTQSINHFLINSEWYLVDLPGYGYTKTCKQKRKIIQKIINDYLHQRKELICLFVLIDCRHNPQKNDITFINELGENSIPFSIVFTKIDKLSWKQLKENIYIYQKILSKDLEKLPPIFTTSSKNRLGEKIFLNFIEQINQKLKT
jgi:GTP-binding protein